ncbi:MAG TPA: phosphoadenylyl-sulfate reductase [Gemmatimonadales bacterium]|jgi:phosphoadenosine phosphosulfate reductase
MSPETLETIAIDERSEPQTIVAWMLERFAGRRLVLTTSFGMEGCALIDMIARHGRPIPVIYLDTMFLFPETYELRDRLIERYPHLSFENRGTTLTPQAQAERYGAELWRRDPDECCRLRKVEPMRRALQDVDVWVTGLMRSQSAGRSRIETIEWDPRYEVIKINPLAQWDRRKVWEYIQDNHVPFNALHERGYPTIGCTHCTVAVRDSTPEEYSRAGRWSGTHKSECGLHKVG